MASNHSVWQAFRVAVSGQSNTLTVHRIDVDFMGSIHGALLLNQIIYWSDRGHGGEFYKTYDDWFDEIGLERKQVAKIVEQMKEMGFLTTVFRKNSSGTPMLHYCCDIDKFMEVYEKFLVERSQKSRPVQNGQVELSEGRPGKKCQVDLALFASSDLAKSASSLNTEITTKTTSERRVAANATTVRSLGTNENNDNKQRSPKQIKNDDSKKPTVATATNGGFVGRQLTAQETFAHKAVEHLHQAISAKGKIMRRPNIKKWRESMLAFVSDHWDGRDRIKAVLRWYCEHVDRPYVPRAYSVDAFIDKFVSIEDSMKMKAFVLPSFDGMTFEEINDIDLGIGRDAFHEGVVTEKEYHDWLSRQQNAMQDALAKEDAARKARYVVSGRTDAEFDAWAESIDESQLEKDLKRKREERKMLKELASNA